MICIHNWGTGHTGRLSMGDPDYRQWDECTKCGKRLNVRKPYTYHDRVDLPTVGMKGTSPMKEPKPTERQAGIIEALEAIAALPTLSYDKDLNEPANTDMHIGLAEMHGHESAFRAIQELKR